MEDKIISKSNPVPYYLQLKSILQHKIVSGVYEDILPSEKNLAETFKVSRPTVRQAIEELQKDGLIIKRKGQQSKIIFQQSMSWNYAQELISFTEEMRRKNMVPSSRVINRKIIKASPDLSQKLSIEEGEEVILLERIRYGNGQPMNIATSYLPHILCPGVLQYDFARESLHEVLRTKYRVDIVLSHETIEAIKPTAKEAKILGIRASQPILLLSGLSFTAEGRAAELFQLKFIGEKDKLRVKVLRRT